MEKFPAYKRIKVNWWIVIIMIVCFALSINEIVIKHNYRTEALVPLVIVISALVLLGRFKVIVNDDFAIFRSDVWVPVKIPISHIMNVCVKRVEMMEVSIPWKYPIKYQFDFVSCAVIIKLKNGKSYQIAIKDAERIKEEIEKRMFISNNNHQ